ncbi:MAG: hypothetical protein GY737_14320 [Desulfobacteraceae bacterium]|nr:hypothetical protein [Desulfobacteraceae bacterium]
MNSWKLILFSIGAGVVILLKSAGASVYYDSDDYVYAGRNTYGAPVYRNYLADIKYLDAGMSVDPGGQKYVQVMIGLDAQNPMAEAMPNLSIFIDADQNPLTGCILPGWIREAEYRIDVNIGMGGVIDPTKTAQIWVWKMPTQLNEAYQFAQENLSQGRGSYYAQLLGTTSTQVNIQNGLDHLSVVIPVSLLGHAENVNLFALAYLPHISSINPYQRDDLGNRQGDRAPDYGYFDTSIQSVVAGGPESMPVTLADPAMDNTSPQLNQAGPDLRKVHIQALGDQYILELEFEQDLIQSTVDPNVGFIIKLDTDRNLCTGQIAMGGDIPTWGGDVLISWAAGPMGNNILYFSHDTDFNSSRIALGGAGDGSAAVNDATWQIEGNLLKMSFSKSMLDIFTYGYPTLESSTIPDDYRRMAFEEGVRLSVQMLVQSPPAMNEYTDCAPVKTWVFDTTAKTTLPPFSFDPDKTLHLTEPSEPYNATLDITAIDYQIDPDYLIIQASIDNWIPNDWGILFEVHLDTDSNSNTGLPVKNDWGNVLLGADYSIQVDSFDDYVRASHHLQFTSTEQTGTDMQTTSHSHDAWLCVVPPPQFGQAGKITITLPRSELFWSDGEINTIIRTGKYLEGPSKIDTLQYHDYVPNTGTLKMGEKMTESLPDLDHPDNYLTLTDSSPITLRSKSATHVYGCQGANNIIMEKGAGAKLINFPGSNTITIQSDTTLFSVYRSGATVTFQGTDGTLLIMPATTTPQSIIFNDKSLDLKIDSGSVMLDNQVVGRTSAMIE